jgi:hypothetical protein
LVRVSRVAGRDRSSGDLSVRVDLASQRFFGCAGLCRRVHLIVCTGIDSAGLGRGRGSGMGWHLCSGCAGRVADGLPFYTRRWMG